MSIVESFAGIRVKNGNLWLNPSLPELWQSYSFRIIYQGGLLKITVGSTAVIIENISGNEIEVFIGDAKLVVAAESVVEHNIHWQNTTV